MKRFAFALETLLNYRTHLEEAEKTRLTQAHFLLKQEQMRLEQLLRRHLETMKSLTQHRRDCAEYSEIRLHTLFLDRTRKEIGECNMEIGRLEKELQARLRAYADASRGRKVMENLKSRRRRQFDVALDRDEQKLIDELVVSRYSHKNS